MYREHWSSSSSQFYINTDAIVYTHIGSSFVRQGSIIELLYISFLTTSWGISNREFFLSTTDFFNLPEKKKDIFNCPFYKTFSCLLSQAPSCPWLSSTYPDFTFCCHSRREDLFALVAIFANLRHYLRSGFTKDLL